MVFLTSKKSFIRGILLGLILIMSQVVFIFTIIRRGHFDIEQICLVWATILAGYGFLLSSIMLYEVTFYPTYVRLEFYYLFFLKKNVTYNYEDIRVVLCRSKHKLRTFYKKGFSLSGISTAQNKYWQKEQINQMIQLLSYHNVPVKNI